VKVAGVYDDLPLNSEFHLLKFLAPWPLYLRQNEWIEKYAANDGVIILLKSTPKFCLNQLRAVSERIKKAEISNIAHLKEESARNPEITLYPMSRWHLFPYPAAK
jgi:hypothetical protein